MRAHLGLLVSSAALGGLAVVGKITMREIPPGLLCLARAGGSAVILHAAARWRGGRQPRGFGEYGRLALFSLLGVVFNQLLFLYGLNRTTATAAAILVCAIPVFTAIFAVLLNAEVLTVRRAGGIGLAVGGVLVLLNAGVSDLGGSDLVGNLMIVANAAFYGIYLVLSRPLARRLGSLPMMAWIFTFGTLGVLPLGLRDAAGLDFAAVSARAWAGMAYIVVFASALAYWLVLWALPTAGSTVSASYTYLQPVVAAALAAVFLSERLTARDALAAALVFAGVYLTSERGVSRTRAA